MRMGQVLLAGAFVFLSVAAGKSIASGASDSGAFSPPPEVRQRVSMKIVELTRVLLKDVADSKPFFKLLRITLPEGETVRYGASPGFIYQLAGSQTVILDGRSETLGSGSGMYIPGGKEARHRNSAGSQSVYLHFLLVSSGNMDEKIALPAAGVEELFRTSEPLSGLRPEPYVFNLSQITFPPGMPWNEAHYRSGGALYYVRSGTGLFITGEEPELKREGDIVYEPYGLVHQWANPGEEPLEMVTANISPEDAPAILFGVPHPPDPGIPGQSP